MKKDFLISLVSLIGLQVFHSFYRVTNNVQIHFDDKKILEISRMKNSLVNISVEVGDVV